MMRLSNERGQLTIDFLFGGVLIIGISVLVVVICIALTLVESVQYLTFSAARSYFGATNSPAEQEQLAAQKAMTLAKNLPFLSNAIGKGWIVLPKNLDLAKDYDQIYRQQNLQLPPQGNGNRSTQFIGYQIQFQLPILNVRLPLLNAVTDSSYGDSPITASSFLVREPTFIECQQYMALVYRVLSARHSYYSAQQYSTMNPTMVIPTVDNGC